MTPLEASTTCPFSAQDGLRERGPRRILGTQTAVSSAVAVSATQAKFGTHSLDLANTSGAGGLQFERGGPFSGSTYMSMDCWVYFRSHRASDVTRIMSANVGGALPSFSLRNDSSGRPVLEFLDGNNSLNPIGQVSALPLNTWVHLAGTYDGNYCRRLYVGGALVAASQSVTSTSIASSPVSPLILGAWNNTFYGLSPDAYVDEARFVFGHPVFEQSFALPTAPFADGAANVALLLHGEGTEGGTTIADSSSNGFTPTQTGSSGNVTTGAASARFGSRALQFGGTQSIRYAASSAFNIASATNACIEAFVTLGAGTGSDPHIFEFGTDLNNRFNLFFNVPTLSVSMYSSSGGTGATVIAVPEDIRGRTVHLALVKEGAVWTVFIDGQPRGSAVPNLPAGNLALEIGREPYTAGSQFYFKGAVDEFRVTVGGSPVYSLSFTPPTAPLADIPKPEQLTGVAAFGAYQAPLYSAVVGKAAARPSFVWSEFSGKGTIGLGADPGEVLEQGTPNTPLRRRVWLMRDRDGQVIREAWSDAATGAYSFTELDETQRYTVIAFDHLHNYRAVIADTRDLDLLLTPWTEHAWAERLPQIVTLLAEAAGLRVLGEPSVRPHGRLSWTLVFPGFGDPRYVDVSGFPGPPLVKPAAASATQQP